MANAVRVDGVEKPGAPGVPTEPGRTPCSGWPTLRCSGIAAIVAGAKAETLRWLQHFESVVLLHGNVAIERAASRSSYMMSVDRGAHVSGIYNRE